QVGLYGLLGATAAPLLEQWAGLSLPWWALAAVCWLVVAVLGVQAVDVNGTVLAVLLLAEIAGIVVLSISTVLTPAGGQMDMAALAPGELVGPGAGAILVLAVLGFIGFEAATVYAEESRNPRRTVPVATYTSVIALALMYTFASWAMTVAVGTDRIIAVSQEQETGVIFGLRSGPGAGAILVLAVLGFIGFEAATVYAEESRNPRRTVPVATYTSVIALALMYTFASWAMTVAVGTDRIIAVSQEQETGVIFGL